MIGHEDEIEFDFATTGSDLAQVLGAIYATERLEQSSRLVVGPVLRTALRWRGPIRPPLVAYLPGAQSTALSALADPRGWALAILGFARDADEPSKRAITRQYRVRMRDVHPDHGGEALDASKAILDLNEARRILTGSAGR